MQRRLVHRVARSHPGVRYRVPYFQIDENRPNVSLRLPRGRTAVRAATLVILVSCGGGGGTSHDASPTAPSPRVASVAIGGVPTEGVVLVGVPSVLTAVAKDANGSSMARVITWSTSNATIASVSPAGAVTGIATGGVTITATSDAVTADAALRVREGLTVPPASATSPVSRSAVGGIVTITIPPGAVPVAVSTLTVAPAATVPASSDLVAGTAMDFGPSGTTFSKPLTIALKYNDAVVEAADRGRLSIFVVNGSTWDELPGSVTDQATSQVSVDVSHFSTYAILRKVVGATLVASVTVSPSNASLTVGQTQQLMATPKDASGNALTGRTVTWVSSAPSVATVSSSGLVTAVAVGSAVISAASEGKTSTVAVSVAASPNGFVGVRFSRSGAGGYYRLMQDGLPLLAGVTYRVEGTLFTGQGRLAGGDQLELVGAGRWIAPDSMPINYHDGQADFRAYFRVPENASYRFQIAMWTFASMVASNLSMVAVPSGGELFRNERFSNGIEGWSTDGIPLELLTQSPTGQPTVATVTVSPSSASLTEGQTQQLTATPKEASGSALTGRTVTWVSSAPSVATVSSTGLVTAVAAGSATISATVEGQTGTATISATMATVATVTVSPSSANLTEGQTQQLAATPKDAGGNVLSGRTVTWVSSAPSVATVSSVGLVTAVAAGSATVSATSAGRTGTAAITVTVAMVAAVTVSPSSANLAVGQTHQLTATARDASGNALTGRAVSWTSSAPSVATVSGAGLVTAVAAGGATISATSEGQTGTAAITVTVATVPVSSVTVSPSSANLTVGQTQQLTATPKDASGNALAGRAVTWVSSAPSVATVSSTGLVTAVAAGGSTISATSEGQTGTTTIAVTMTAAAAPVATVTISPSNVTLTVGEPVQLTATLRDSSGNTLTGRTVTWSGSSHRATVSATGLVTALIGDLNGTRVYAESEGRVGFADFNLEWARIPCSFSNAPAISLNQSIGGSFSGSDCLLQGQNGSERADVYRLTITREQPVEMFVSTSYLYGRPSLYLFDATSRLLNSATVVGIPYPLEASFRYLLTAGTYYVAASSDGYLTANFRDPYGYWLLVQTRDPCALSDATPVSLPTTVSGTLTRSSCLLPNVPEKTYNYADLYKFQLATDGKVSVSYSPKELPFLAFYDGNGNYLGGGIGTSMGNGVYLSERTLVAGTYYVAASIAAQGGMGTSYSLTISRSP